MSLESKVIRVNKIQLEQNDVKSNSEQKDKLQNETKPKLVKYKQTLLNFSSHSGKCEKILAPTKVYKLLTPTKSKQNEQERKHVCDICNKGFTSNFILTGHKRVHTGEKPFKCDICDKSYTQRGTLIVHKRIHSGLKPFKCNECGKSFDQSGSLKQHLSSHNTEKTLKCPLCDKLFRTLAAVYKHNSIVHKASVKEHPCEYCDLKFPRRDKLRVHINTHSRPFKCDLCPGRFSKNEALKRHKACHENKPGGKFKCKVCEATYDSRRLLGWHCQTHYLKFCVVCNFCEWRTPTFRRAEEHLLRRHAPNFDLKKCGGRPQLLEKRVLYEYYPISRQKNIPRNLRKRVPCKYCDTTLDNALALDVHCQSHPVEYKYRCPKCSWRFREQKYLDAHLDKVQLIESESDTEDTRDNPDEPPDAIEPVADEISVLSQTKAASPEEPFGFKASHQLKELDQKTAPLNSPPSNVSIKRKGTNHNPSKNEKRPRNSSPTNIEIRSLRQRKNDLSYQEEISDTDSRNSDTDWRNFNLDPDWLSDDSSSYSFSDQASQNEQDLMEDSSDSEDESLVERTSFKEQNVSSSNETSLLEKAPTVSNCPSAVSMVDPTNCAGKDEAIEPQLLEIKKEIEQKPIEDEVDSKSAIKKWLISQGCTPIRIYHSNVPIKHEITVKEEPQSE